MRHVKRDIVSAIIISKDGKIFHGRKNPQDIIYADCWLIPGGGVDEEEDKIAAVIREVKEETGMDISGYEIKFVHQANGSSEKRLRTTGEVVIADMTFYDYLIHMDDKNAAEIDVHLDDDLVEYKWFSPEELKKVKIPLPSQELFIKLGYL